MERGVTGVQEPVEITALPLYLEDQSAAQRLDDSEHDVKPQLAPPAALDFGDG
jgi:hypothetical protein